MRVSYDFASADTRASDEDRMVFLVDLRVAWLLVPVLETQCRYQRKSVWPSGAIDNLVPVFCQSSKGWSGSGKMVIAYLRRSTSGLGSGFLGWFRRHCSQDRLC